MASKTSSDKWEFFGALNANGINVDALKESLHDWDLIKIENYLSSYRRRAEKKLNNTRKDDKSKDEPIDIWYDFVNNCHVTEGTSTQMQFKFQRKNRNSNKQISVHNNYSFLLGKAMMYAAYFENHYEGEHPNQTNYSEIYRYLGHLLLGEPPVQLRPGNAAKVLEMIGKLKELIDNKDNTEFYQNYLSDQHQVSYIKRGIDPLAVAQEKKDTFLSKQIEADELFEEYLASCEQKNPNFNSKKDDAILKISLKQKTLANILGNIPGMNPLEMPPESSVKPMNSKLMSYPTSKYKRKSKKMKVTK